MVRDEKAQKMPTVRVVLIQDGSTVYPKESVSIRVGKESSIQSQ